MGFGIFATHFGVTKRVLHLYYTTNGKESQADLKNSTKCTILTLSSVQTAQFFRNFFENYEIILSKRFRRNRE
jgi:hypothetical protein